ncbi:MULTISPECIES: glycosyltransferase [unclassified Mycolicibacterium]|uniref:glycosyltransferase n=1 Tax=unclassified Mycolicibacterium TaxID=2636767 RepID=UPI001308328E|nr:MULTISPECIES: nucleotide disphospho-sugar-binding domain-containing protein [unclassified Mycolicibacterium]MUL80327.1 glycosyl transferase [Mycolicibacterium sp. CBMA 329]MUL86094.1 glycosyl transferase [Mycolicibacterium sp. CBMA 331]MUM00868.1 glycosyl transferase [Mycolicibacterium sp. CBMA 334]MUM26196.1 glycosyl transferase [Mycolicibacterium sp. CBMA 295]MUM36390.1 glycosyl transferase [Mycolicibacterium sp. CBMA 247]
MRVAVVAGPDPGHAFPALALCLKFLAAGDTPTLLTGVEWLDTARAAGIDAIELVGLDPTEADDDADAGSKIHQRAGRMALLNVPGLGELSPDLVVSDVITACGGLAAELLGLPWVELSPHPLYLPSKGLPPIGSGFAPGVGIRGHLRDSVMRALTARSWRAGLAQRAAVRAEIGLAALDSGPLRRLIATLPALEVPRPDWPAEAVVVGPLHFEPTNAVLTVPPGAGPVVVVAPSTATTGAQGMAELALESLRPGETLPDGARLVVSRLGGADVEVPPWAVVGLGRQDELLAHADLVICGGGHGMVSKTLLAGVPMVVVPGGGDQWEIANRVVRQGSAQLVRPLSGEALTAAVGTVLGSPSYRAAARRAGASLAEVSDPVRVCHDALDGTG